MSGHVEPRSRSFDLVHSYRSDDLPEPTQQLLSERDSRSTKPGPNSQPLPERLNAEDVTERLTASLSNDLTRSELRTFRLLHTVALKVAARRGYSTAVSRVTFFCPAEVVAHALGIHRCTLWRHLKIMLELGLLDVRAHKTTYRGQTVTDGSLWCIKLHPGRGKSPRLSYDELKAKYRDLVADIEAGRTAYALVKDEMQQSLDRTKVLKSFELVLAWTLTPATSQTPVKSDCCNLNAVELETVLDVPYVKRSQRNEAVDLAAQAIGYALGDAGSHAFYCRLLWSLTRRRDAGQDYFMQVYQMILRARTDHPDGFARSAGALFVSRLKRWEVWDWLESTPMVRVGVVPCDR